jgi:AcrR family transcriptional regulator
MGDRRSELVDAGVDLVLSQRFQDLLASVDTRSITERAGVTTGSFFHHFRNRAAFAEAVLDHLEALWARSDQRSRAIVDAYTAGTDLETAATSEWEGLDAERSMGKLTHLLLASAAQPVTEGSERSGVDVLAERYRRLDEVLLPAYRRSRAAIGREMMPPFTEEDLAVALTAVSGGLDQRRGFDPGAVRDGLLADCIAALVLAMTRPVGETVGTGDLRTVLDPHVPAPVAPAPASARSSSTWRQIADAAAPLFAERSVADVKISEIAAAAGVSASTVYAQLGTASAVAACGWARHLPELEAIAAEPLTTTQGPVSRIEQVLTRIVELAREHRGAAEGWVIEAMAEAAPDPSRPRPRRISEAVPLADLLVPHVRELRTRGVLRRRIDTESLATSALQLVVMRVLTCGPEPVERTIDETFGVLLEGALARPGTGV